ncbi:MAG: glycosyltransferase [Nitrosomonadales bacterium]|nr:glycosyltransferase [Nitrosomonadales bacterium]
MNILKLIKRTWNSLPLSDKNRWRVTRLLLEPVLPLLKGSIIETAYLREKEWQSRKIRPFSGDPFPVLPFAEKPDIIIWSVIDWRYRIQRPQHLARGFAERGYRVFYISTSFVNTKRPGFELESLDDAGRLYNVRCHLRGRPLVYKARASEGDSARLRASIASLLEWSDSHATISIVQHPYWHPLVRKLPNSRLIYDCLDHHEGFGNTGADIAALEQSLLKEAEAVVTTSQFLYDIAVTRNSNTALVRNAAEYDFFSREPDSRYCAPDGQRVIGYYGAIAEWMDLDLLEKLARQYPDCLLLLVGADDRGAARQRLAQLSNVLFTGEVRYQDLPYYLYGMDVCLLPFLVTPLTLATNPLKVYEYLSAGKTVVSVKLPEIAQFDGMVAAAETHDQFVALVGAALREPPSPELVALRRDFAAGHTWPDRVSAFEEVINRLPARLVSVIIVTYNNLALTQVCLDSLERYSLYEQMEIVVVDNASTDGTPDYLTDWQGTRPHCKIVLNADNLGFAAANNQGLGLARGEYLVLLNNDTEVTPGWLRTLMNHLRLDNGLGIVGPVTNNIGNEARIKISYKNAAQMRAKARAYTLRHIGETFPITTLAFFCVMMPRRTYEKVGPLDEAFGLGFFEDDDYCRRIEQAGLRIECAEDVFIHHHLAASFSKLGKGRQELLERNRKIYEAKWGPWTPHRYR